MEAWRRVWRIGLAPSISDEGLKALEYALRTDQPTLIQGMTTSPPPLACVQNWAVNCACGIAYAGWRGHNLKTVSEVEVYFATLLRLADERLGESGASRYFLNWFDDTSRPLMLIQLHSEVIRELDDRAAIKSLAAEVLDRNDEF